MGAIRLVELVKRFGEMAALDHVSLDIADGEFLVLVGPSGCGKTTCLRIIAGLESPTSGEVHIGDRCVTNVSPKDRDTAMVFQDYALYPHMSVHENMAFGLKLRGTPRERIDEKVRAAAQMLGMEGLLDRRPSALSGGQRQRVALGRAVVREPQCFLMDEPLSNLDAKLRVQTRAELIRLHKRLGITTVYVTHDQAEAMTMGDRIAVMKDGLIQQCDTPMELFERPVNRFVAGFIGSPPMNFLPAVLEQVDGALWATGEGFRAPLDARDGLEKQAGREVVIGLRPTDMRAAAADVGGDQRNGRLEGVVDVIEPMGPTTLVYLLVGDESVIVSVGGSAQVPESGPFCVEFDRDRCHVFDPDDGRNLCQSLGARPTEAGR